MKPDIVTAVVQQELKTRGQEMSFDDKELAVTLTHHKLYNDFMTALQAQFLTALCGAKKGSSLLVKGLERDAAELQTKMMIPCIMSFALGVKCGKIEMAEELSKSDDSGKIIVP